MISMCANDKNEYKKWQEMRLIFAPKFHVLHKHVPNLLLELSRFHDMGEDTID